ncbi:MAG: hypothetical protein V4721_16620 [Bacteroidota bacterium]
MTSTTVIELLSDELHVKKKRIGIKPIHTYFNSIPRSVHLANIDMERTKELLEDKKRQLAQVTQEEEKKKRKSDEVVLTNKPTTVEIVNINDILTDIAELPAKEVVT